MVKLVMNTLTELQGEKAPHHQTEPLLSDAAEISLQRDTIVSMRQHHRRFERKHAVGLIIAAFIILVVGGALAGFQLKEQFRTRSELDNQCPGCENKEPEEHRYQDEHRDGQGGEGKRQGGERGDSDSGRRGGDGDGDGKAGLRHHMDRN